MVSFPVSSLPALKRDSVRRDPMADMIVRPRSSPGRFYAVAVLKMMVGHVVDMYDIEVTEPDGAKTFSWRSAIIPRSSAKVSFRPKGSNASKEE